MTFKELEIGRVFEFTKKSNLGGGMWNGEAVKKSESTYVMITTQWVNRFIGNVDVEVIPSDKDELPY